nr:MAG TPA_asm: hypothetical protein [Caudoviricetes sp.]
MPGTETNLWRGSHRGSGVALAHRFKQADAGGHRDVERRNAARHRNADQLIAMFTGQATHALTLCAHHQRHRAGHFALEDGMVSFSCGADNPDVVLLQQTQRTRQVGDADQRHIFRRAAGHFFGGGVQRGRTIFRHDNRVHTGRIRAAQTGAQIVRVGDAIQHQQERFVQALQQIRQIALLILTAGFYPCHDALMHPAFDLTVEPFTLRQLNDDPLSFQRGDHGLQATIVAAFEDKDFLKTLWSTFQQRLHGMDTKNNFAHQSAQWLEMKRMTALSPERKGGDAP